MVQASDIGWGSYQQWEGPYFGGVVPYVLPDNPDFLEKCMSVVTATEGGHYDAINMYDSCILSVGIIQVCERVFGVSNLLQKCTDYDLGTLRQSLLKMPTPADFKQDPTGKWKFFFVDGRGFVDNVAKQQTLFLGGSTGLKGQWTDDQKAFAKQVAAVLASVWSSPGMQMGQREFVKPNLMTYVRPAAKATLFTDPDETGFKGAIKAAIISYSANLPAVADKYLALAVADPAWSTADDATKFTLAMKQVVFGPQIAIWPHRYQAIKPVIQKLFGVTLPTLEELHSAVPGADPNQCVVDDSSLTTVVGVQKFLVSHGYDIGPSGPDGIEGNATRAAIGKFQMDNGLQADGVVGPNTRNAMLKILGC